MGNDDFRPDHRPPPHFHGDEGPGRFNGPRGPEENQERGMPGEPGPRGMMELNERPVPIDKFNTERGPPYKFSNQDESTARKAGYHGNPNFGQSFPDEEFRPDNGNNMDEKQSGPHDYRERHPGEMQHQENNGPGYGPNNPEMNAPGEPMFQGSQTRTGYHGEDMNNRRDHIEDRANENRPPPDKYQQFPDSSEFRPPNPPHNPPRDTIHPEHFQHPKDEPHRHEMPPPDIRDGRMPIGNNNHGIKVHHSPHNENQERGDFEQLEPRQGTGIHDNQRPRESHRRDNEENIHERNMDMRPPDHIPHRPDFGQMHPAPPGEFRDKPEHIPHMSGPRPPPHPEPHDESRPLKGHGFRPEQSDRFPPDRMMPHDERFHTQEEKFQERHRQHEALQEQENFGVPDRIRERHLESEESPMDIVNENARRGHLSQGQRPHDRHGLPSHHEHHNPNIQARLTPHRKGGPGPSFHNREAARQHQLPGSEGGHSGHPRDGLKPPIPEHGRSDHRIPGDAPDANFQPNRGDNGMRPAFELHHRPEPGHRHPEHHGQLIQNKPRLHLQQQRQQHKNPTEDDKNAAEKERFIKEKFSKAHKQLIFPRQSVPNQRLPPQANNNMQQQFDNRRSHMIPLRPVSREHPIEHHSDLHTARDPMKPMFGRQDRDFHDFFEPKYGKQAEGNHPFKHEDFPKFDLFKNDNNRESMPGGDKHGESGVYAGFLSQLGSTPYPDISHNDKFMNNKPLFHNEADTVTNPPEYYERTKKRAKTDLVEELVRYNSNSQREPMDNNNYQQPEARSASSGASDSKGNPSTDNLGKEYFSVQEPERHHRSKYPMFLTVDTNQYIDGNRRKDGMNNFDMNFGKSGFGSEDYNHLNPPGELSKLDKFLRSGFNEKDPAFQNMNSFGESENQNVPKLFGTSVDEVFGKSSGKSASIWSDVGGAKNYGNDSGFGRLNDSEKRKGLGQKPADGKTKHKVRKVKRVQRHWARSYGLFIWYTSNWIKGFTAVKRNPTLVTYIIYVDVLAQNDVI